MSIQGMARRFESGFERKEQEAYFTEPRCTEALLRAIALPREVWEPACGRGDVVKVLEAAGCVVLATDLVDHGFGMTGAAYDFLDADSHRFADAYLSAAIVTNPPYGRQGALAERFIARALDFMMPRGGLVAMLLRYDFGAGHGPARLALMWENRHYSQKLVLPFRPRWDDWWNGRPPEKAPYTNFAWYVWDARHCGPPIERMIGRAG